MVDSWYCLDRFVPEGISQVEVGNTKRRALNTRLSSGTSAGTFAVSAGPYINYHAKAGTKNEPWHVFGTISKKGFENRSSRFEPKNLWLSFSRGSGPPLINSPKIKKIQNQELSYIHTRKNTHWTSTLPSHTTIPRHRSRLHPSHSLSYRDKYNQKTHSNYTMNKSTTSHFLRCTEKTLTTFSYPTPHTRLKK